MCDGHVVRILIVHGMGQHEQDYSGAYQREIVERLNRGGSNYVHCFATMGDDSNGDEHLHRRRADPDCDDAADAARTARIGSVPIYLGYEADLALFRRTVPIPDWGMEETWCPIRPDPQEAGSGNYDRIARSQNSQWPNRCPFLRVSVARPRPGEREAATVVFYELNWWPANDFVKHRLLVRPQQIRKYGGLPIAWLNRFLRSTFVTEGASDLAIYYGGMGHHIRDTVRRALCIMTVDDLGLTPDLPVSTENAVRHRYLDQRCGYDEGLDRNRLVQSVADQNDGSDSDARDCSDCRPPSFVFATFSLGSYILFDTVRSGADLEVEKPGLSHANGSESSNAIGGEVHWDIFVDHYVRRRLFGAHMFANQLSLLSLRDAVLGCEPGNFCPPRDLAQQPRHRDFDFRLAWEGRAKDARETAHHALRGANILPNQNEEPTDALEGPTDELIDGFSVSTNVFRFPQILAINDPNDILGFRVPCYFQRAGPRDPGEKSACDEEQAAGNGDPLNNGADGEETQPVPEVDYFNLATTNAYPWLGIFADPVTAHTGGAQNERVHDILWYGVPKVRSDQDASAN
ncbi:hypothetical protein JYU02_00340 [bacterium AH-315-P15]|nr:hypothetical protein [bacterium AH-315-P15]